MVLINDNSVKLPIGAPIPHFALPSVDGQTVDSSAIRDNALVVIFTCNHCPYAQAYEDRIIELWRKYGKSGAAFVLISSNDATDYPDDSFAEMKVRAEQKAFPFPYCYDESQEVAKSFGALCTPHCFVFDAERKLRYKGRVDDNWKEPEKVTERNLSDAIKAVIAGQKPPKEEANAIGCSIKWKK